MNGNTHRSGYRLLLVDDHEPLAEATAEFMRTKGFDVRVALTGREALETAAAFRPEIVLCDLRLPDISGLDVAQTMRKMPGLQSAVIAIHTAMTQSDLRSLNAADPHVDLFLSKPITAEKLDSLVSRIPSRARKQGG
jgi:DNA-binding response OmpR family regulator